MRMPLLKAKVINICSYVLIQRLESLRLMLQVFRRPDEFLYPFDSPRGSTSVIPLDVR
jgi:hypothetical protein